MQRDAQPLVLEDQPLVLRGIAAQRHDRGAPGLARAARGGGRLPRASRRSTPCWPAAGSLSGANILSMPAIGRPLTSASAPPAASYSAVEQLEVGAPACTAAGSRDDVEQRAVDVEEEGPVRLAKGGITCPPRPGGAARARARDSTRRRWRMRAASSSMRPGPAVDVELLHQVAHAAHARALLVGRHGEREVHRRGALLDVVGVDDQRLGQLARRAGELRQDQHALLVVARSDDIPSPPGSCRRAGWRRSTARPRGRARRPARRRGARS